MKLFGLLLIAGIILCVWMLITAIRHPCLESHTERVLVPELTTYTPIQAGNVQIPITSTTPAHYEDTTVCDQYK